MISPPTLETDVWKWRVYLPPGPARSLFAYHGMLPDPNGMSLETWLQEVRRTASGSGSWGGLDGEFLLEMRLAKEHDYWTLLVNSSDVHGGMRGRMLQLRDDWLNDPHSTRMTAINTPLVQESYEAGKPIVLLQIRRAVLTESPDGRRRPKPQKPYEGIVVWLE